MKNDHGARIESMFDRISPRYDLLNRIISGGRDLRWRRRAVDLLGDLHSGTALDICCGTGDFIKIFINVYGRDIDLIGIDFSRRMLDIARRRFGKQTDTELVLSRADAMFLPVADGSVDAITIGFGIRNVADRDRALRETYRVLRPGGKLAMIEPARPANPLIRRSFLLYFKYISPLIGGLLSGDRKAYRYLHDSFVAFPAPEQFTGQMKRAGYEDVRALPQFFGTAMIYIGRK